MSVRTTEREIKKRIDDFRKITWSHYRERGRYDLPWRKTRDPYKILVSEVMLQQTRVSRVLQKYPEFLKAFPTLESLAKAPLRRILRVWQGMGYNRRAIALKRAAARILMDHGGKVPPDPVKLKELPGVGKYTANAVCIFAFDIPLPCIETNIRRVYIHYFFSSSRSIPDVKLLPLIEKTLDRHNPREWFYALMDYGASLPRNSGNPNRRSRHYMKQSPFKGSRREVRGLIIKTLLREGALRFPDLKESIARPHIDDAVRELVREGFLQKRGKKFSLA